MEETTECGLRSRLGFLLDDFKMESGSSECSAVPASRVRVERVERPAGSLRFKTGLSGSTSGLGSGVPPPVIRRGSVSILHTGLRFILGGVASAAMMSDTTRELCGRTGRGAVEGTF
jgi:hypothetical protein